MLNSKAWEWRVVRIKPICITAPLRFPMPFISPLPTHPPLLANSPCHATALKRRAHFKGTGVGGGGVIGKEGETYPIHPSCPHPPTSLSFAFRFTILLLTTPPPQHPTHSPPPSPSSLYTLQTQPRDTSNRLDWVVQLALSSRLFPNPTEATYQVFVGSSYCHWLLLVIKCHVD